MKKIIFLSLILAVLIICFPLFEHYENTSELKSFSPDAERTVTVLREDFRSTMNLHEYLVGVLAAEMPASFEAEALKAQAVAARTYFEYQLKNGKKHNTADLCSDPSCCTAYLSQSELMEKWGSDFFSNLEKVENAVSSTDGLYLLFENEPILAVFHSSSAGQTASSEEVWQKSLPYLQSVSSPESEADTPGYKSQFSISVPEFITLLSQYYPDCSGNIKTVLSDSGRISSVFVGDKEIPATELRSVLGLRSCAFDLKVQDDILYFYVTGYGHGVGMSQYGANTMAKAGNSFSDILSHYYPGSALCLTFHSTSQTS